MKRHCLLALLLLVSSSNAAVFDYWGFRLGGVKAASGDYGSYERPRHWGSQVGLLGGLNLSDEGNLYLQPEFALRLSMRGLLEGDWEWPDDKHDRVFELLFAPSLVYSFESFHPKPFLLAGVEGNLQLTRNSILYYSDGTWRPIGLSLNLGGGLEVPYRKTSLVLDLRYNLDLTDQLRSDDNLAPHDSFTYREFLILFGFNFN